MVTANPTSLINQYRLSPHNGRKVFKTYPRPPFPLPYCRHCFPVRTPGWFATGPGEAAAGLSWPWFVNDPWASSRVARTQCAPVRDDTSKPCAARPGAAHTPQHRQGRAVVCALPLCRCREKCARRRERETLMPHDPGGKPPRERSCMTVQYLGRFSTREY
jgi:hypothetical protein